MLVSRIITFILLSNIYLAFGQSKEIGSISGHLNLHNGWDSVIHLSYIPTFESMYAMSSEMILSEAIIDSLGYFAFDISFLPEEENLFRLHVIKKGDVPASLIIGGKDANHLFLIADRYSNIELNSTLSRPPFRDVVFAKSSQNIALQRITDLVYNTNIKASESSAAKRQFIEDKLYEELLFIADTSSNPLVSLYAIYCSNFEYNYNSNLSFYKSYLEKWRDQKSAYFKSFRKQLSFEKKNLNVIFGILSACIFLAVGFFLGKYKSSKNKGIEKLSVQERKIFDLLKQGATNQEISEQHNIGISTVKSHVSNIFTKLNVKSRREIMNIE